MISCDERLRISKNLDDRGVVRFGLKNKGRAEVRDGLVYVDGDDLGFENPMTFDTFKYHFLDKYYENEGRSI